MLRFAKSQRDNKMTVTVSYQNVPTFRAIAFCLYHIDKRGGHVTIYSGDRRDSIIAEHNKSFGTHLMGQQALVDGFRKYGPPRFNPANPPDRTSHCLRADATVAALLNRHHPGLQIHVGGPIPWWALPLDLSDRGKREDVSNFLRVARDLGYRFVQPYSQGSERHHVMLTESPIEQLVKNKIISKDRG